MSSTQATESEYFQFVVLLTSAPAAQGGHFDRNEIVNVKYHSRKENDISCLAN